MQALFGNDLKLCKIYKNMLENRNIFTDLNKKSNINDKKYSIRNRRKRIKKEGQDLLALASMKKKIDLSDKKGICLCLIMNIREFCDGSVMEF